MAPEARVWTRDEIANRILDGDNLVIYREFILRIPESWLQAHPGGALAILHFVGRDATDEIEAYHFDQTLNGRMRGYIIGKIERGPGGVWEPLVPPLAKGWVRKTWRGKGGREGTWVREAETRTKSDDSTLLESEILLVSKGTKEKTAEAPTLATLTPPPPILSPDIQQLHSDAYRELHKRVTDARLYETPFITGYGPEFIRYFSALALSTVAYKYGWFKTSAVLLGFVWHQMTFFVHDLGHMGVTHNWALDRVIGIFVADLFGGLSVGWWVDNHNIHHLVTNHPVHDPDIQHMPFFAISNQFLNNLYSSYYKRIMLLDKFAAFVLQFQHKLYFIVMSLARFNLYANSYAFLAKRAFAGKRDRGGKWTFWLEVFCLILFWAWYIPVLKGTGSWTNALAYLLITNMVPSPLHVQIVLSHFACSTADFGPQESFPHRQLRTTTDVICPDSLAFLHGGLHLQVTHHLFPRLPRHNLRAASLLVKEYAKEQGLEYAEFGFLKGNGDVLGVLKDVAEQARIVGMVAKAEVEERLRKG